MLKKGRSAKPEGRRETATRTRPVGQRGEGPCSRRDGRNMAGDHGRASPFMERCSLKRRKRVVTTAESSAGVVQSEAPEGKEQSQRSRGQV